MLALTPTPLQTAGERALFAELARWDTGGAVRAAVVASLPLTDGPLNRRLSDAVLFVPEGIAVLRIAEVVRQSGVVTALPEGSWTIGPEGRPGDVLQIGGGGSSPLDGLMRAGMDIAVRLRTAGLEPGRIARLTVLVGDVTGLVPADGDLGEGDQVSLLDTRSLLLGIARSSRYTGVDNPRLWTTADVRAALEALGLPGRGPVVEELNGEGFPYSPYVLRRRGLMAPAAMAAMAASAGGEEALEASAAPSPVAAQVAAHVAAQAAAAPPAPAPAPPTPTAATPPQAPFSPTVAVPSPASGPSGSTAVAPQTPPGPPPTRDTVAIDEPEAPATREREDAGIGGFFADSDEVPTPSSPPRTSVFAQPPPHQYAAPVAAPPSWGQAPPVHESFAQPSFGLPSEPIEPADRRRTLLIVVAALVGLLVVGLGGWLIVRATSGTSSSGGTHTATQQQPAGPTVGSVQQAAGVSYTAEAVKVDTSCDGHAYGQVDSFLQTGACTGLSRALYSADLQGRPIVASVIRVRMADAAGARALQTLTDKNGSGNVASLLREGVRYSGGPTGLPNEAYASAVSGSTVTIVETSWVNQDAAGSGQVLDAAATAALALDTPPFRG